VAGGQNWNSWSGQACNPYDTERVPRGTSSGSGVAVSANLVTVSICEQSGASCQGPASRNGIALVLPTKGVTPDSGGIGNMAFIDRAGIHARTLGDAARVPGCPEGSSARLLRFDDPLLPALASGRDTRAAYYQRHRRQRGDSR
jgi:Asp-tRNA(Asn)/Glu-tRNA(Gln) amidotransferase A subunit family amidase